MLTIKEPGLFLAARPFFREHVLYEILSKIPIGIRNKVDGIIFKISLKKVLPGNNVKYREGFLLCLKRF